MCGIFFSLSNKQFVPPSPKDLQLLKRRGPDSFQTIQREIHSESEQATWYLTVSATVLSLRGDRVTEQPIEDPHSKSLFCWNGEAWTVNGDSLDGNDAQAVFDLLLEATRLPVDCHQEPSACGASLRKVADALGSIAGPFAFLYFDAGYGRVFFGRDVLGRRSLLKHVEQEGCLIISSISSLANLSTTVEIEANGIYTIDILNISGYSKDCAVPEGKEIVFEIEHIPWSIQQRTDIPTLLSGSPLPQLNKDVPAGNVPELHLSSPAVIELRDHLKRSLGLRVQVPTPPSAATHPARIGILFSGGLDCAVLARICHDILPYDHEIDLLNVAFENPRVVKAAGNSSAKSTPTHLSPYSVCPDRLTGLSTHAELLRVCPERTWRFVSIDVPYAETLAHRSEITTLIYPHHTEMDLSIACALYFAARGAGTIQGAETGQSRRAYTTPARVLLSGLGADEIFGGYTRHSTAFRRAGYEGLIGELDLDVLRLSKRNLGRDDRVISNWGKEVRYPYLDEALMHWALRRPVWEKCGFRKPYIDKDHVLHAKDPILEPAKLLLRLVAWRSGMKGAAAEKKRAIQFGTRTAKMEAGRTKGTETLVASG